MVPETSKKQTDSIRCCGVIFFFLCKCNQEDVPNHPTPSLIYATTIHTHTLHESPPPQGCVN